MSELDTFKGLKEKLLLKYREHYPFFSGNWKSFSAQDIQNLIGLFETECGQSISEKWIYTHLKPDTNTKLPRKAMLDILSIFVGFSGWDELVYQDKEPTANSVVRKPFTHRILWVALAGVIFSICIWSFNFNSNAVPEKKTLQLKDEFTNKKLKDQEVKVFKIEGTSRQILEVRNGSVQIENPFGRDFTIEIKSPFYKKRIISFAASQPNDTIPQEVELRPDDYPMMLKAFMLADIKDWQTRKIQLNKILSDELEVMLMLKDDLGAEYFNKKEFSQKLIIPTASLKQMKIVEIKSDDGGKISFIRIKQ